MLQRMERTGLVERRRDPEDARLSRVYLTQRARALEQPLRTLWSPCDQHPVADMPTEERLLVRRLLLQTHANISSQVRGAPLLLPLFFVHRISRLTASYKRRHL